jgi:AAA+ superfamily predicted ATPase
VVALGSVDNIPDLRDPGQGIVTISLTKHQAKIVLAALNNRFYQELEFNGGGEIKSIFQLIDHQLRG